MDKEEIEQKKNDAVILTNVAWLLADMIDMVVQELNDKLAYIGKELGQKNKQNFKKIVKAAKELNPKNQGINSSKYLTGFGYESDMILQLMLALVDRTDQDPILKLRFYDYIKSFPSKTGLDLTAFEQNSFNVINKNN